MKRSVILALVFFIGCALFADEILNYAPIKGNIKNYTKTEYSIASKFGNYFRTPSVKFSHAFDENGLEVESTELSAKDAVLNKINSVYDEENRLKEQICTDAEGVSVWKSITTYKDGLKIDVSEYDALNSLKGRTIFTYENRLLIDESSYNGDGVLVWKTTYKYNAAGKCETVSEYFANGTLSEQSTYTYTENGNIDTVSTYSSFENNYSQKVFRYSSDGALNEITTYDADKQVSKRLLLKYDASGNVARISDYEVSEKFGTVINDLVFMAEYVYEY